MKSTTAKARATLKPRRHVNKPLLFLLALASIGLGVFLLRSMLAASGLSDAALEAGYTPPLANVESDKKIATSINWLQILVITGLITVPLVGGALYLLRSIKS